MFFTSIGSAIAAGLGLAGTGLGAAVATGTALAATAATGIGIAQAGKGIKEMSKTPEMPVAKAVPESVKETAGETITKSQQTATAALTQKKRAASRSRSVYTSPLGIGGEASTIKKSLLGQ